MKTLTISKPGKSKQDLLNALKKIVNRYEDLIKGYNGEITEITDGYKIYGKKFLFYLEAEITAEDGKYIVKYDSNAPQHYINKGIAMTTDTLKEV